MTEPLEPLKPITAQQQDEFNVRRESASVVQHACSKCGAWYETPKRSAAYQEAFLCDCGNPMTFTVPPFDASSLSVSAGIGLGDLDQRLESGMTIRQALADASYWWGKTGRHMMKKHREGKTEETAFATLDPNSKNFMPSAILNGEPWDQLDNREKVQVVKAWHHHFIRNKQT